MKITLKAKKKVLSGFISQKKEISATKVCSKCKQEKPRTEFCKDRQSKDGIHIWCNVCRNSIKAGYYKRWSPEQREAHRGRVLKCRYGISVDRVRELYIKQNGKCAICHIPGDIPAVNEKRRRTKGVLCVDHCHVTGKVRGLLCDGCNQGISRFKDEADLLIKAAKYLEESICQ